MRSRRSALPSARRSNYNARGGIMRRWTRRSVMGAGLAVTGAALLPTAFAQPSNALLRAPRRALVIGNGAYPGASLSNPRNDAGAITEELKRTGFEVATALDVN